jgi:hypothetical protein
MNLWNINKSMFYTRINKIKEFDNREDFFGLFDKRAEIRVYDYRVSIYLSQQRIREISNYKINFNFF